MDAIILIIVLGIIIEWCMVFYIVLFLFHQYLQKQLQILLLWAVSFVSLLVGLSGFLGVIILPLLFSVEQSVILILYIIATTGFVGMIVFAFDFNIFVEYASGRKRTFYLLVMNLLGGLLVGVLLTPSQFTLKPTGLEGILFISLNPPPLLVGLLCVGYFAFIVTKIFGRMLKENWRTPLKKKFIYVVGGTLIHAAGFFLMQILGSFTTNYSINLLFAIPSSAGLLLLIKGLRLNPQYLIYLKQKAFRLMVIKPGGEILHTYKFLPLKRVEENYLSAALLGLNQFLQTTLNLSSHTMFDAIDIQNYKILCAFRGDIGLILIVSNASPVFRQTLEVLLRKIPPIVHLHSGDSQQPPKFELEKEELTSLNALIEDTFFFYPETKNYAEDGKYA